ncbi:MAG: cytochrome c [Acidobacteriota bacterium]|nr:cytochrome c [Acidobacteriota bacterium]
MGRVFFGFLIGVLAVIAGAIAWLSYGNVPVAVTDAPFPMERFLTHIPLNDRIQKEMIKMPPVLANEQNLVAGARIYADKCAVCHGLHGKPSSIGGNMYPPAPPLWEQHKNSSVVGVSDDPAGETFWKIKNGIRLTGMPTYRNELTDTEIWQVSQLLANADKPLPPAALQILSVASPAHDAKAKPSDSKDPASPWWKDLSDGGKSGSASTSDSAAPQ